MVEYLHDCRDFGSLQNPIYPLFTIYYLFGYLDESYMLTSTSSCWLRMHLRVSKTPWASGGLEPPPDLRPLVPSTYSLAIISLGTGQI